ARKWLEERGVDLDALMLADDAVQIVSGRVDSAKLLYALPTPMVSKSCAPFPSTDKNGEPVTKMGLDFRCASATGNSVQDALPPTIHPGRGAPYEWRFGAFASWQALPPLPSALMDVWLSLSAPVSETVAPTPPTTNAAPAAIQAWLQTQDPGMSRNDWIKVGMKLHAEFEGSMDGFQVWQAWSSKSVKWDDEARTTMLPIWKGFKLEGRPLTTLAPDLRALPADPAEFDSPNTVDAAPVTIENAAEREIRELMQPWVVLQTGGGKPYFLLPGHPIESVSRAAGLAGVELNGQQLADVFGPHLPPIASGKKVVIPDPVAIIRYARWRQEVFRVGFQPGAERYYRDYDGHDYLNAYTQIPVEPIRPTHEQIAPLEWLLRRVLDDKGQPTGGLFAAWLVRLYAFVLRNPGVKVKWAPLLYSAEQGTGKTTLMETLPALLFGRQYVKPMTHSVLRERFAGAQFESTWWVCLTEMHSDAGKVDARAIANKLKPWITDPTIQIEKKGVDSYEIKNHLQFTAASNHDDALFIEEGTTDRRWLIGEMLGKPLTPAEMGYLNPLFGDDFRRHPNAAAWLKWYFLEDVNIDGFNPSEPPPMTMAKKRVQEHSRSNWEDIIFEAIESRAPPFDKDLVFPKDVAQGLLAGRGVTVGQARTLLRKAGAFELPRTSLYRYLYAVRHGSQWETVGLAGIRQYLNGGPRPFTPVDSIEDLL
ncbi:MAG: PriCT-2 domain-containing protein, partial [Patescibacteria group bacterium]|nr:PriCT-2 domain-containing protein [Patescibacteria group bacterium]